MALASTHHELDDLGGGRFRHVQHMKPIASYKNGNLRRDPFALAATGDGTWPLGVDGICNVRVDPRIAGKSPLLHMGHGSHFVRFALVGANNVSGTVKGNTTTFTNAWNGADLRYTYGGHRLQEDILLRAKHPRSFGFILREHTGFDPVTMTVGDIRILDPVLEPPTGSDKLAVPLRWIVSQQGGYWVLTVTLPAGDWAGWTIDPTLTLQPDAADGKDALIKGGAEATRNYGVGIALNAGNRDDLRFLIQFDLSTLPDDAVISSAALVGVLAENYAPTTTNVHRLKRAWVEGTRNNADDSPATGVTWNRYDTTNNWQTPGGMGADDAEATPIGSTSLVGGESTITWSLTPTTKAALDLGNGWIVDESAFVAGKYINIHSSDWTTAGQRPKLTIEYTLPSGRGAANLFLGHLGALQQYGG